MDIIESDPSHLDGLKEEDLARSSSGLGGVPESNAVPPALSPKEGQGEGG